MRFQEAITMDELREDGGFGGRGDRRRRRRARRARRRARRDERRARRAERRSPRGGDYERSGRRRDRRGRVRQSEADLVPAPMSYQDPMAEAPPWPEDLPLDPMQAMQPYYPEGYEDDMAPFEEEVMGFLPFLKRRRERRAARKAARAPQVQPTHAPARAAPLALPVQVQAMALPPSGGAVPPAGATHPDRWSKPARMGSHMRIQARVGYRAAVIELKPGLYIVAEVPEHFARAEFGAVPLLAPLMVRAASRAVARREARQQAQGQAQASPQAGRPGLLALFQRNQPPAQPAQVQPVAPVQAQAPFVHPVPATHQLPGPVAAPPQHEIRWVSPEELAGLVGFVPGAR